MKLIALTAAALILAFVAPGFPQQTDELEKVLQVMDKTSVNFRAAQANFVWTMYNSVVNDISGKDEGTIYFRRSGKDIQMGAEIKRPGAKQIVFYGGKIQVFQSGINQVDIYDASAHKEEFEAFLVLGFGSSATDIKKSFTIKYIDEETIDGVKTAKLELTPLSDKIKNQFPKIDLWIDLENGISVQQQLFQHDGDYRLAKYSNIQLKQKIPNNVFELKVPGGAKKVTH